jgi:hypothetical protein
VGLGLSYRFNDWALRAKSGQPDVRQ